MITKAKISHQRNYKYKVNPSIGVDKSQVTVNCNVAKRLKALEKTRTFRY